MKKNKIFLIILIVVFLFLLVGAYFLYNKLSGSVENNILSEMEDFQENTDSQEDNDSYENADSQEDNDSYENADSQEDDGATEVTTAPDFTVTDASGNVVKLSDFLGKPVILNFWASWCGPCKSEMPDFETAYLEYGEDIHFLMVNLTDGYQETVEVAQSFIEEQGYTFPVYYDTENQNAAITYGVFSIPTTYFIDAEGNFVAHAKGALDMETLQTGISMIYKP